MEITLPRSYKELKTCIEIYYKYNEGGLLPQDFKASLDSLYKHVSKGDFLFIIRDKEEIVAWILAIIHKPGSMAERVVQQIFYGSKLTGVKAVKALKLAHKALVDLASYKKIRYVFSCSSHQDFNLQLCRILEKDGWQTEGYFALYKLPDRVVPPKGKTLGDTFRIKQKLAKS